MNTPRTNEFALNPADYGLPTREELVCRSCLTISSRRRDIEMLDQMGHSRPALRILIAAYRKQDYQGSILGSLNGP